MLKINRKLLIIGILLVATLALAACTTQPQTGSGASRWEASVARIENTLNQALGAYEKGQVERARQLAKDAYFDAFESSGLETAIRLRISSRRAFEVENGFSEINQLLRSGADSSAVRQQITETMAMIREDTARLTASDGGGQAGGFRTSFFIIVREGFEAILIIGAIIAYLVKSGNGRKVRVIYQSAIIAILASIATAVIAKYLLNISGASVAYFSIAASPAQVEALVKSLETEFPAITASPIKQLSQAEGQVLTKIQSLVLLAVAFILLLTLLCLAITMMNIALERRREIGLRKALGGQDRDVILEFVAEGVVLGLAGGLVGWGMGLLVAQGIGQSVFQSSINLRLPILPLAIFLAAALVGLAAFATARIAARVRPGIMLKGE